MGGETMMKVGIPELRDRAEEIVQSVRRTGEAVDIEESGVIIARVIPATQSETHVTDQDEIAQFWSDLRALSAEISKAWPAGVSAEEAINDVRREL